ncbi:MAG: hypothetical protein AAF125_09725 [Chloroflexota bacterium]
MANNKDRSRKLLVRTALVTSTTIATLIGAQQLAFRDMQLSANPATTAETTQMAATGEVQQAAPHLTILRDSSAQVTSPVVTTQRQPVPQRSRSSR